MVSVPVTSQGCHLNCQVKATKLINVCKGYGRLPSPPLRHFSWQSTCQEAGTRKSDKTLPRHSHDREENEPDSSSPSPSWDTDLTKQQAVQQEAVWPGGYFIISDIPDCYKPPKRERSRGMAPPLTQAAVSSSLGEVLLSFSLGHRPGWFEIPRLLRGGKPARFHPFQGKSQPSYKIIRLTLLLHSETVNAAHCSPDKV